jgi:hypothetical protein
MPGTVATAFGAAGDAGVAGLWVQPTRGEAEREKEDGASQRTKQIANLHRSS